MVKTNAIYTPSLQLVIYSAMAMLMFLVLLLRGDASAGDLVAYITLAGLLPKPIRQLSEVSSTIQKAYPVPKVSSNSWTKLPRSTVAPSSMIESTVGWRCGT